MAGILKSLGSDVTQIIRKEKVLRSFDTLIVDAVTDELEEMGINLSKNNGVSEVQKNPEGNKFFNKFNMVCISSNIILKE